MNAQPFIRVSMVINLDPTVPPIAVDYRGLRRDGEWEPVWLTPSGLWAYFDFDDHGRVQPWQR